MLVPGCEGLIPGLARQGTAQLVVWRDIAILPREQLGDIVQGKLLRENIRRIQNAPVVLPAAQILPIWYVEDVGGNILLSLRNLHAEIGEQLLLVLPAEEEFAHIIADFQAAVLH